MERISKWLLSIFLIFGVCLPVFAEPAPVKTATTTDCIKTFPIGYEKLYYLTLAATNQFNYTIKELQTKSGYIMFADNKNKVFLASVIYVSSSKSMLKLAPCDNTYSFTVETPNNIFRYIEENQQKTF